MESENSKRDNLKVRFLEVSVKEVKKKCKQKTLNQIPSRTRM
jgi:hypothetical protein